MFQFYQSSPVSYDKTGATVDKEMLAKCFVQVLLSIPDYAQRLALCEKVEGKDVQLVLQECQIVLDTDETLTEEAPNLN